ncbi:MAG TPA: ATP-binding protein [Pyrinomonadaceae bacterium]|nr:ATP-binding protein [Pyrinomonadaceae bacterium]
MIRARNALLLAAFILLWSNSAFSERLSFKAYTTADGLASDQVNKIVADSRGFLWFCTAEGLSRFDGYKFKNYTQEHGLPARAIMTMLETADGDYLFATTNGLAVFDPNGTAANWNSEENKLNLDPSEVPLFKTYFFPLLTPDKPGKRISTLVQDGGGTIYAGTSQGIRRVIKADNEWRFETIGYADFESGPGNVYIDSRKDVWVTAKEAIYWISKAGEVKKIEGLGFNSFFEDSAGNIYLDGSGNPLGIRVFKVTNDGSDAVLAKNYTDKDGFAVNIFTNIVAEAADGRLFAISDGKLYKFDPSKTPGKSFELLDNKASSAAKDLSGNIWFVTPGQGVAKYAPNSFTTQDMRDGMPGEFIRWMFPTQSGEIYMAARRNTLVHRDLNGKIESIVPYGLKTRNWTHNFLDLQAHDGEWWIPSLEGLRRYPKVAIFKDLATTPPKKVYTTADGLFGNAVFSVFEDSKRDIWFSAPDAPSANNSVLRYERATDKIHQYTQADGLNVKGSAHSFGEDSAGNIWIAYFNGQVFRYKNGTFRTFSPAEGIAKGFTNSFYTDSKGRFWLTVDGHGLYRTDDPDAEVPTFINYTTAEGLSSNDIYCVVEDTSGGIYAGTTRGINLLDTVSGRVKVFTTADGLPSNIVSQCRKTEDGKLWFTANDSLIQYEPRVGKRSGTPPVLIDSLSVNGAPRKMSELGETEVKGLEFSSDERQVQIGFSAISLDSGESLRYQYKLNDQEWSLPDVQRSVSLNLASGTYKFEVRALNADGIISAKPATVAFRIDLPVWQRWWFLLLTAIVVCTVLLLIFQYRTRNLRRINSALTEANRLEESLRRSREERIAELQRVRTRIATDLHDDIGSSLTQIAVLSEVARNQAAVLESEGITTKLESIKGVSRELVESMSDVVWAINPNKDNLSDLVQRMRRFGSDYCAARDIRFELDAPPSEDMIPLGANVRREVFAIFKEAVNNSVKYSECKNVRADFRIENDNLLLNIADDGQGFDTETTLSSDFSPEKGGNGLVNMRRRVSELGGDCQISSKIGGGTTILLSVPLNSSEMDILSPAQLGGE